jgi:glycerophosphoryl diester phosphodiesterase
MKIIGHRGAAWLALENTLESIKAARRAGVDAIEFDLRVTADNEFVLSHDPTTRRVSQDILVIRDHTLKQLRNTRLHNGELLVTLENALTEVGNFPIIMDVKGSGWAAPLARKLKKMPHVHASIMGVIALNHEELATFHELLPDIPLYAVQRFNPIDTLHAIHLARNYGFTGVDLNFWLLNPLSYWLANRYKLAVIVYSVNLLWIAKFLRLLFPTITITTDRPDRLQVLRDRLEKT